MYLNSQVTVDADLPDRIDDHFTGPLLDPDRWTASYLPAWSSQAESAATYAIGPDGLRLSIPPEQGLWCADRHEEQLRVSAAVRPVQSRTSRLIRPASSRPAGSSPSTGPDRAAAR